MQDSIVAEWDSNADLSVGHRNELNQHCHEPEIYGDWCGLSYDDACDDVWEHCGRPEIGEKKKSISENRQL